MGFSDVLKLYLNKTQSTAKELSAASGISTSALSRYRSGKRIPDQEQIEKLICGFVHLASEKKRNLMKQSSETLFQSLRRSQSSIIMPSLKISILQLKR